MTQMIKRDFLTNRMSFLIILIMTPFIYTLDVHPIFVYVAVIYGVVFNLFYYDDRNLLNRSIVSLPISKKNVVFARYLFLLIVMVGYLVYLWFVDELIQQNLSNYLLETSAGQITGMQSLLVFLAVSVIVALIMPVFYYFQSFMKSFFLQGVFLIMIIIGFSLFGKYLDLIPEPFVLSIVDFIDTQPFLWITVIALICLAISYRISAFIFMKIDII